MRKASGFILCFFVGALAHAETYIVKKGDTLANIARSHYGEPVFGPKGTIKKIYKLNPWAKPDVALEPGQKVELEDGAGGEKPAKAAKAEKKPAKSKAAKLAPKDDEAESSVVVIPANPPSTPPATPAPPPKFHEDPLYMSPEEKAVKEMDLAPKGQGSEPKVVVTVPPAPNPPPPTHEMKEPEHEHEIAHEFGHSDCEHPHSYFSVIANYSMISQTATDNALGDSFTMHSSPAWGLELGWDHWWNENFSTVFTYAATEFTSKESSDATGNKILKNTNLNSTELALLNRVVHWMRIGLGAGYGDHIFLEGFAGGSPSNPQVYKMSYLNPFLAAEITPYETARVEWLINLKIAELPAQVGFGHDVNNGTEYFAQVGAKQNFAKFSMFYGLSYSTENQTRTDAKETRTETALRIGAFF